MRVVLTGFMGAGKSTVGRRLADLLGWRFVDIDDVIEAMAGQSIPEIFAQGEDVFRQWERQAIAANAHEEGIVIATGGGAVTVDDTRGLLVSLGPVICLDAPPEVLWARVQSDRRRPLAADRQEFFKRFEQRSSIYEQFQMHFDTASHDVETVARSICEAIKDAQCVHVPLDARSYDIDVAAGNLWRIAQVLPGAPGACLVVTDDGVPNAYRETVLHSLHYAGWAPVQEVLPQGEQTKSIANAERLYDVCVRMGLKRNQPIVALGGGVVGDLAGFVAATYQRGVPFVQVPTTLLAQIDSSVGGKVAVNHRLGKNLIGAFYQPVHVLVDVSTLRSLSDREYRAGLAELLKYGVILDSELFDEVERNPSTLLSRDTDLLIRLVARCCELKAQVVAEDERETAGGPRGWLNFGHTLGHAIEAIAGYGAFLHGEAVAIGMCAAGRLAAELGLWTSTEASRLTSLITTLGLPQQVPDLPLSELLDAMRRDKKNRTAQTTLILPMCIGKVQYVSIEERALTNWLTRELRQMI